MIRHTKRLLLLLAVLFFLLSCKKNEFDKFYERPASLESPIFQVLEKKGKFKTLMTIIDKGGYKQILSTAGYWTLFAPNDSAFEQYFTTNNLTLNSIDSVKAQSIIKYLLVYNAFDKQKIDDYQSNTGWVTDNAFKRRTTFFNSFYYNDPQRKDSVFVNVNRNGSYISSDNNNKHIPYFTEEFFTRKNLSASDYNFFFPNSQFSGFNVADARVISKDIVTENGVIHEIDKVVTPLLSIDEYLSSKPEYSEFKKLFDKYMVSYVLNADATQRYKLLTGENKNVYVKTYNAALAFSPNNENYTKAQDNDAQQDGWTIFVPTNDAFLDFTKNVVLEYYKTFDNAPSQIIIDLLNSHMWRNTVWPSKFQNFQNPLGEPARFNAQTDIVDRKFLSNGIFYGTNKVQESNIFSTVYSRSYLDPKFSYMTRLLNSDATLRFSLLDPNTKYTVFLTPDAVFQAGGYKFNTASNLWEFTGLSDESARQRLLRIVNTSAIKKDLSNLAGGGIVESFNEEYIRYKDSVVTINGVTQTKTFVAASGNLEVNQWAMIDSMRTSKNGTVYYLNRVLSPSVATLGSSIRTLGTQSGSQFSHFWNYLLNSTIFTAATNEITDVPPGSFYTAFIPRNAAIEQAVKDGLLPGNATTGAPTFNPSSTADKDKVKQFIYYHIAKKTVSPYGNNNQVQLLESMLMNSTGTSALPIFILTNTANPAQLKIADNRPNSDPLHNTPSIILSQSNQIVNRAMIHLIDDYLSYKF